MPPWSLIPRLRSNVLVRAAFFWRLFGASANVKQQTGVAVSYLIIIGDLMPQVIAGVSKDAESIEYLMDRRFWITAFMYDITPVPFSSLDSHTSTGLWLFRFRSFGDLIL